MKKENLEIENKFLKEEILDLQTLCLDSIDRLIKSEEALELACGKQGDIFECPNTCEIGDNSECWKCKVKYFEQQAEKFLEQKS